MERIGGLKLVFSFIVGGFPIKDFGLTRIPSAVVHFDEGTRLMGDFRPHPQLRAVLRGRDGRTYQFDVARSKN